MKKILSIIAVTAMAAIMTCGCVKTQEEVDTGIADNSKTEVTEYSSYPRTITDASGREIVLETKPKRIVLLHTFYLEHFFALGVNPVAASMGNMLGQKGSLESSELFKPYMENVEIIDLGSSTDLNLEAILESEPDVIITFSIHRGVEEIYDSLAQIAPVILLDYNETWQNQLMSCAEIVDREEKAEEVILEIEEKIKEAKNITGNHAERTFALFRTDGKGFITLGDDSYYETFGITKTENHPETYANISLEALSEMDPYYIAFQHNYEAAKSFVEGMKDSSVWNALDAVNNGRVYFFDENMNTFGPIAMKLTAEKMVEIYSE